jgi:hypothetical protein
VYSFPVGFVEFHKNTLFNFQMNRWYSSGFLSYEVLADAAKRIAGFEDWAREFKYLAEQMRAQEDTAAYATCLRAAEFLMLGGSDQECFEKCTKPACRPMRRSAGAREYNMRASRLAMGIFPSCTNCRKRMQKGQLCCMADMIPIFRSSCHTWGLSMIMG